MRIKNLFHRFSGSQFLENQLNGNAGTGDHGLAHHHVWIGNNHVLVVAHAWLSNPAYRSARGISLGGGVCLPNGVSRKESGTIALSLCLPAGELSEMLAV